MQVWLAIVPAGGLSGKGLGLQRLWSSWDFFRELAAIAYYVCRGWLC